MSNTYFGKFTSTTSSAQEEKTLRPCWQPRVATSCQSKKKRILNESANDNLFLLSQQVIFFYGIGG